MQLRKLTFIFLAALIPACVGDAPDAPESASSFAISAKAKAVGHAAVCPAGVEQMRCNAHVLIDPTGKPAQSSTPSGYGPADLRSAYAVTGTGSSGTLVAIVDAYGYPTADSDLAVYRSQFGLPPCTTSNGCLHIVDENGGTNLPRTNTGWDQEQALDLDMVSAMCPDCQILLVQASGATTTDLGTAVNTAVNLGAAVVSNSYGGGESGAASADSAYYTHPGIAITASSGDNGYGVEFPASSPHVIAVGGTSLTAANNSRGWTETAWSGAGSGCSSVFAKPSWQQDAGCAMRTVADVSAVADPNTGVAVYGPSRRNRSAWMVFGGTSVAAPLVGGIYALGGGSATYGSDPYAHTSALNDVTSGSNGSCGGSYLCTAVAGYDGPTGLGTPIGTTAL